MASEVITSKTTTPMEEAFLRRLIPETIPSAKTVNRQHQSPVDAIIALRKDMAEFQKVGSDKQALRETLRATMKAACMEALQQSAADAAAADDAADADGQRPGRRGRPSGSASGANHPNGPVYPNIEPIVKYLTERKVIRPKLSREQIRRLAASVLGEKPKTSEKGSSEGTNEGSN
jgi:hypothetical protein